MTPKKKGIRIPHMFTLLLLIIAVCTILTYVIPAGQYETYVDENGVEMLPPHRADPGDSDEGFDGRTGGPDRNRLYFRLYLHHWRRLRSCGGDQGH